MCATVVGGFMKNFICHLFFFLFLFNEKLSIAIAFFRLGLLKRVLMAGFGDDLNASTTLRILFTR